MTFRYIGSKTRLIDQIEYHIGQPKGNGVFVDAFCGTGAVAECAANLGWNVRINDSLNAAVIATEARLISKDQVRFVKLGGYANAIYLLETVQPVFGFIWSSYSPASIENCGIERRYFTEGNASRIDAMRALIAKWKLQNLISTLEEHLLIADLLSALNRVANIAGTFGCFLSKWTSQSQNLITIRCRELKSNTVSIEPMVGDVFNVLNEVDDLVYLDPPYTKRQYASYYHILETVALHDTPLVVGVGGLRPWKSLASDFCYKTRALNTLTSLVSSLKAKRVLLSYSSEGHISMNDMEAELSKIGQLSIHPLGEVSRYRPNRTASNAGSEVNEFLVIVEKCFPEGALNSCQSSVHCKPLVSEEYL